MRRSLIILNLLLAAILVYKGWIMEREIHGAGTEKYRLPEYTFAGLKRPSLELRQSYRNIFDVQSSGPAGSQTSLAGDPLSRLLRSAGLFQVRGVFVSDRARYAVLSIGDETSKKQTGEWKKVRVGDKVEDFSVASIIPGTVILANDSVGEIILRIFRKPEVKLRQPEAKSR